MKLISVIIVNHNRKNFLIDCLNSIKQQTYPNIEILLIDDCSNDGSVEEVKRNYPEVHLFVNDREKLLCISQNIGINKTNGEYILFFRK